MLGIVALCVAVVPFVNLVGILAALVGLVLGVIGIVRGRRIGRRTGMAAWGIGLSAVAIAVSVVVGLWTLRYLGDLFDFVDPPEPSAEIGEWFRTDDGDLAVKVTSVECAPSQSGAADARVCTFVFDARNESERTLLLDHIRVKAVVDGAWRDPSLEGEKRLAPGAASTITGRISVYGATLEGLAFDADDASSHSAVVVDVSSAQRFRQ
ncbi:hypothetical protein [Nocardioides humi]|uniref:hypothetical protein n=1 Tax=Nocardioides humi TaxID=449461 RepID=UPI0011270472|nr:hypothetical protein [Nocardioides humi]